MWWQATESVSRQIESFRAPFLVLQGTGDIVTDPALAQEFYNRASSKVSRGPDMRACLPVCLSLTCCSGWCAGVAQEKEIRLYEGFWHNLLSGESVRGAGRTEDRRLAGLCWG